MMLVVKKNGRLQNFKLEKIKISMARASDDIGQPLTESDLHVLSNKIKQKIFENDRGQIVHSDIRKIVLGTLIEMGFDKVAKSYEKGAPHKQKTAGTD